MATKQAFDAMELLQNGDEAAAKSVLDRVLQMDPSNEMGRKLMDQVKADAQKELGPIFFRYTVRSEDSLSKLAQRFLGDRYRFYILAKYNNLQVPNRLGVGEVIKIPGREPPPAPAAPVPAKPAEPAVTPPAPAPVVAPPSVPETPKPRAEDPAQTIKRLTREAEICYQRDRDLDCAIAKWGKVLDLDPGNELIRFKRERAIALRDKLQREGK